MVHRVIEANDSGSVRQTTYLGSRLAVDDLPGSRLAVDDLPGSRLVNAESRHAIHKTDHKQNYYRSFLYKDKLGFHLSRQDQTTFKKSRRLLRKVQTTSKKSRRLPGSLDDFVRRLLGSSDDFQTTLQEVQTTFRKSRRLLDDFQTTNRHKNLPKCSEKSRRLPGSPDDFLEVQTTSWKSRRLPGSPDNFLEVQTTLSEDFQEVQTTSRRLTGKSSQKSSRSEKPAYQIQI
ncbi:hypothetical protein IGI04_001149 [Brassica rapa subsp. trilocularis]|uniref:Uncharacterized protein n=1 Tax=Brassica rapa subsp. trilocularis TaxID=1813537 RepID=A0ABQ7NRU6_BRACM|nr:hypothetical protein IGI04_001149 [Brassica rapa subsp. trilocularis]